MLVVVLSQLAFPIKVGCPPLGFFLRGANEQRTEIPTSILRRGPFSYTFALASDTHLRGLFRVQSTQSTDARALCAPHHRACEASGTRRWRSHRRQVRDHWFLVTFRVPQCLCVSQTALRARPTRMCLDRAPVETCVPQGVF